MVFGKEGSFRVRKDSCNRAAFHTVREWVPIRRCRILSILKQLRPEGDSAEATRRYSDKPHDNLYRAIVTKISGETMIWN